MPAISSQLRFAREKMGEKKNGPLNPFVLCYHYYTFTTASLPANSFMPLPPQQPILVTSSTIYLLSPLPLISQTHSCYYHHHNHCSSPIPPCTFFYLYHSPLCHSTLLRAVSETIQLSRYPRSRQTLKRASTQQPLLRWRTSLKPRHHHLQTTIFSTP